VIYDTTDAKLPILARGSAHPEPVESIAWTPDGKRLATGAYRRVVLWDADVLEAEARVAVGLTGRIAAIRFIDSSTLAVADGQVAEEGTIRLVDANCGSVVESWVAHSDSIFDLAVTSDGGRLASAGGDKLVKIWDLQTRTEIARLEGHQSQVLTVRFDTTGERLLTGGADQQLKVWSVKTKDRIMTLGKHSAAINGAVWIEAGPAVLAITDAGGAVRYTDLKEHSGTEGSSSGTERKLESADTPLYCMAATAAGDRIFAGSHDGRIFVWDKDGKLTNKLETNASAVTVSLNR
jgi:WD40 repeat protein